MDTAGVVDFGAGDGALLERSVKLWPSADLIAIEADPERSKAGARRFPAVIHWTALIQELDFWPTIAIDVAFFMPGRLLEFKPGTAAEVLEELERRARFVVFYAYGDVLVENCGLEKLLELAFGRAGCPSHAGGGQGLVATAGRFRCERSVAWT